MALSNKDKREFEMYLSACTDRQVIGVYEKELTAGRKDYVRLAEREADRRGISLS